MTIAVNDAGIVEGTLTSTPVIRSPSERTFVELY